jgi:hypothetical protein
MCDSHFTEAERESQREFIKLRGDIATRSQQAMAIE